MPKFNPEINFVYCDLDGVLADMDRFIAENVSVKGQVDAARMWTELAAIPHFYMELPATPYAAELWLAILDLKTSLPPRILTAIPRVAQIPTAQTDKRYWCNHVMRDQIFRGNYVMVDIGPYSRDKQYHANPGDVLIDDKQENIEQWQSRGGIGIYHDGDVKKTIAQLRALVQ